MNKIDFKVVYYENFQAYTQKHRAPVNNLPASIIKIVLEVTLLQCRLCIYQSKYKWSPGINV